MEEGGGGGAEDWVGACGWGVCLIVRGVDLRVPSWVAAVEGFQGLPWIGRIEDDLLALNL